jgi:hypothetical protein
MGHISPHKPQALHVSELMLTTSNIKSPFAECPLAPPTIAS